MLALTSSLFFGGCAVQPKPLNFISRPAPAIDTSGLPPKLEKKVLVISASDFEKLSQFSKNNGSSTSLRSYESRLFNRVYSNLERSFIRVGITPISTISSASNIAKNSLNNNELTNLVNTHILVVREISVSWSSQRIGSIGTECYYPTFVVPLIGLLDAQLVNTNGQILWSGTVRFNSASELNSNDQVTKSRCDVPTSIEAVSAPICLENGTGECRSRALSDEVYDKATSKLTQLLVTELFKNNN